MSESSPVSQHDIPPLSQGVRTLFLRFKCLKAKNLVLLLIPKEKMGRSLKPKVRKKATQVQRAVAISKGRQNLARRP